MPTKVRIKKRRRSSPFLRNAVNKVSEIFASVAHFVTRLSLRGKLIVFGGCGLIIIGVVLLIALAPKTSTAVVEADRLASLPADEVVAISAPTPAPTLAPVPTPSPTPDPTLRRGDESLEVQLLQERLMDLGYLDIDESTQFFGPATEAAVELFQRQVAFNTGEDFDVDGIAGAATLALLYTTQAPKYVVKEGMSGQDITDMQRQLVDLGYMRKTTGYYGTETIEAIRDFQSRNKLSSDGLAGEQTVSMLYSDSARESSSKANAARTKANISKMIDVAKSKLGCKYVRGAQGSNTFDCSGLVYYCLKEGGSNRRRLNAAGYSNVSDWEKITSINSLKKGDLIFFYNDGYTKVGHVGIIVSSTEMIDASSSNGKVVRRAYKTNYWQKHFVCGRRPW